jgi:hypothetical protein
MNSSRRWLIIFTSVIGVLVIATVALVLFTKGNEVALLPEDTPQGIVQRYLMAVQEKDYPKAYSYLSFTPTQKDTEYDDWIKFGLPVNSSVTWKATLGKIMQNSENATVEVTIDTFRPGGPFEDTQYNQQIIFQLVRVNGSWFITSPTYLYWIY